MFQNNLYTILDDSEEAGVRRIRIRLDAEHALYTGHFPGHPVTPGAVQMEIVKELLEIVTGRKLILEQLRQCKFLAVNNPRVDPEMAIVLKATQNELLEVQAEGRTGETVCFRMSAGYGVFAG